MKNTCVTTATNTKAKTNVSRRRFLQKGTGISALLLSGVALESKGVLQKFGFGNPSFSSDSEELNLWIALHPNSTLEIFVPKAEMGQGVYTSFAMIIAEEMNLDPEQLKVVFAPSTTPYTDSKKGLSVTGGSTSVRGQYNRLRLAGAAAKERIVQGVAFALGRNPAQLMFENGLVQDPSTGESWMPGEFIGSISEVEVEGEVEELEVQNPALKDESSFDVLGKEWPSLDRKLKTEGKPIFGQDVVIPEMRMAAIRQAPVFGGTLSQQNFQTLKQQHPELELYLVNGALALVSESSWQAQRSLDQLDIPFESGGGDPSFNDEVLKQALKQALETNDGVKEVERIGLSTEESLEGDGQMVADYFVPFLPHMCMETMVCVAKVGADRAEIWVPTQSPGRCVEAVAKQLSLPPENIQVHATHLGGGFGRKVNTDCVEQAVSIALQSGKPIKLMWSREEDTQHDFYRPAFAARFSAKLCQNGTIESVSFRNAGPSILRSIAEQNGRGAPELDPTSVEGLADSGYHFPNLLVNHVEITTPVPLGFWRSVGASQNGFFVESFVDELAHLAGKDPLWFRMDLLKNEPRMQNVLRQCAELANWDSGPSEPNRAYGVAIVRSFGSVVAQIAEVGFEQQGGREVFRVHRVYCVVDCGFALNPLNVKAQMESGIVYGLSAALSSQVSIEGGRCVQGNFNTARVLSPRRMPKVVTQIVNSGSELGGIGEPGTPPIAPAVANALFRLNGTRLRKLPLEL